MNQKKFSLSLAAVLFVNTTLIHSVLSGEEATALKAAFQTAQELTAEPGETPKIDGAPARRELKSSASKGVYYPRENSQLSFGFANYRGGHQELVLEYTTDLGKDSEQTNKRAATFADIELIEASKIREIKPATQKPIMKHEEASEEGFFLEGIRKILAIKGRATGFVFDEFPGDPDAHVLIIKTLSESNTNPVSTTSLTYYYRINWSSSQSR